jgi:uncharacterized membrane protein
MTLQITLIAYAAALAVFLILDTIWLSTVGASFYRPALAYHLSDNVRYGVAFAFYAFYVAAVIFFAVRPALAEGSGSVALLYGAFFGLAAYATYDLSNLATMKNYPASVALVDMAWGSVLTASSAYAGFRAAAAWG